MKLLPLLVASACVLAPVAHAQLRSIPEQAKDGQIRHLQDMMVSIDGVAARLAPGVQIRDRDNRLVLPTAVPPGSQVKYLLDEQGMVRQVWILTPAEANRR